MAVTRENQTALLHVSQPSADHIFGGVLLLKLVHGQFAARGSEQLDQQQSSRALADNERVVGEMVKLSSSLEQSVHSAQSSGLYTKSTITNEAEGTQSVISNEQLMATLVEGVVSKQLSVTDVLMASPRLAGSAAPMSDMELLSHISNALDVTLETEQSKTGDKGKDTVSKTQISILQQESYYEQEQLKVQAVGDISLADGRTINFDLRLEFARDYREENTQATDLEIKPLIDPLVLSLDGAPVGLQSSTFIFDLDVDGEMDELAQLRGGTGFLALDLNEDGSINDGSELFGTQSGDGFADLAIYDRDGNGWIDGNDEIFNRLKVWQPGNEGTLQSLSEAGVGAVYLGSIASDFSLTDNSNQLLGQIRRSGLFIKESGEVSSIEKIDLSKQNRSDTRELETRFEGVADIAAALGRRQTDRLVTAEELQAGINGLGISGALNGINEDSEQHFLFVRQSTVQNQTLQSNETRVRSSETTQLKNSERNKTQANPAHYQSTQGRTFSQNLEQYGVKLEFLSESQLRMERIIDEVLRPMQEQLLAQRRQAVESYHNTPKA